MTQGNFPTCFLSGDLLGCGTHQTMESHDRRPPHPYRRLPGDGSEASPKTNDGCRLHPDLPAPGDGRARPGGPPKARRCSVPHLCSTRRRFGVRWTVRDRVTAAGRWQARTRILIAEVRCLKSDVRCPMSPDRERASSPDYDYSVTPEILPTFGRIFFLLLSPDRPSHHRPARSTLSRRE